MHLVDKMIVVASENRHQIILSAERRQFLKRRWRGTAADGTEFGFDLDSRLVEGCVIFQTGDTDYIIRQLPETVYEIPFTDSAQASLVAWKVGNLHLPAQVTKNSIRVLHDVAMKQLLSREAWHFTEPEVIFEPMKTMSH
jgi:urease accessory protein